MLWSKYKYNSRKCAYEDSSQKDLFISVVRYIFLLIVVAFMISRFCFPKYSSLMHDVVAEDGKKMEQKYYQMAKEICAIEQELEYIRQNDAEVYRTLLQAEPIKFTAKSVPNSDSIVENCDCLSIESRLAQIKHQVKFQKDSFAKIKTLINTREKFFDAIPAIQPISNNSLRRVGDTFGMRSCHPVHKIPMMHKGIDYIAPIGTKIYATGAGIVRFSRYTAGYGNMVEIDHGRGIVTRYAHLSRFNVKAGERVLRGQCVGYVGNTGTVTGPHLHYEVIKDKVHVNPTNFLLGEISPGQYEKIVEVAQARRRKAA